MRSANYFLAISTLVMTAGLSGCDAGNAGANSAAKNLVNMTTQNTADTADNSSNSADVTVHGNANANVTNNASNNAVISPPSKSTPPASPAAFTYIAHLRMRDATNGVIDGFQGKTFAIGMTSDGGRTWTKVKTPSNDPARTEEISLAPHVALLGNGAIVVAWAVNNKQHQEIIVDTTSDDGQTWQTHDVSTGKYGGTVASLMANGASGAWLVTSAGSAMERTQHSLLQSHDSGHTWSRVSVDDGYVPAPFDPTKNAIPEWGRNLQFTWQSPTQGWVGMDDNGMAPKGVLPLMQTTDGGSTWQKVDVPMPKGYVRGKSYLQADAPAFNGSTGTLAVQTWDYHQAVTTYRTTNDGKTWTEVGQVSTQNPVAVSFADGAHGMLLDQSTGTLKMTANGGTSWKTVHASGLSTLSPKSDSIVQLKMLSANEALCVVTKLSGQTSALDASKLYRTTDGGKSWTALPLG